MFAITGDHARADRALASLERLRTPKGGYRYGEGSNDINTWATVFAAQALLARAGEQIQDWLV